MDDIVTLGVLKMNNKHDPVYTLELPWQNNKQNISCIPEGKYKLIPHKGTEFKDVYCIKDVPGRNAILFHIGNYLDDTKGCVLPGLGILSNSPMVVNSRQAIETMHKTLGKKEHDLEIINL